MSNLTEMFRSLGRADALALRKEAANLSGTEIIAREYSIPAFDPQKDYSGWPVGSPVADEGQVWTLIQPHNAAYFAGRPSELRALWGLAHTKDPAKAKPWVDAHGTSGLYKDGECYKDESGVVHRCKVAQTNFDAEAQPSAWETVEI